jgi:hypothetical protein
MRGVARACLIRTQVSSSTLHKGGHAGVFVYRSPIVCIHLSTENGNIKGRSSSVSLKSCCIRCFNRCLLILVLKTTCNSTKYSRCRLSCIEGRDSGKHLFCNRKPLLKMLRQQRCGGVLHAARRRVGRCYFKSQLQVLRPSHCCMSRVSSNCIARVVTLTRVAVPVLLVAL